MRQGRRVREMVAANAVIAVAVLSIPVPGRGDTTVPAAAPASTTAAVPYWQAPALPSAIVQGGQIPPGWHPQAVPYQGIGPDGRTMTMYFAPTYVFTYQSGPPVLASPTVNRPQALGGTAATGGGWNYRTSGAQPVPTTLPPPTVARYQPAPYQFPPGARALGGTPIMPPAEPPPPPVASQSWGVVPPTPSQWAPAANAPVADGSSWEAVTPPAAATGGGSG